MTTPVNTTARCMIRGHSVEVRRNQTEAATYNVGIDGSLVAIAPTADRALWEVAERIRLMLPLHYRDPKISKRFRAAVAAL